MRALSYLMAVVAVAPGCTAYTDEVVSEGSDDVMEAEVALTQGNALASNALALNGIALNGLAFNGIALNTMDPASLTAIRDPGSQGALARSFLKYAIGCAFNTSQSFAFSWTDSSNVEHQETYNGELGVATAWATGPLTAQGQAMVSACVAARVNYYEMPVTISMRSLTEPLKTLTGCPELAQFPDVEGAFWGNLWAPTPYIHACYNSATVANSRAWKRDCAVGHLVSGGGTTECGMIDIVGPCSNVCQTLNSAGQYYPSCIERPGIDGTTTKFVITTGLP